MGFIYSPFYTILALPAISYTIYWFHNRLHRNGRNLRLPPGPKGLPLIGSILDMPTVTPWIEYHRWAGQYGKGMVYFTALGKGFLVLTSATTIQHLLFQRSEKYSDRPRMPMILEVMDYSFALGFMPYGDRWRHHRKAFMHHFNPTAIKKYHSIHIREVHSFLIRMLDANSGQIQENIRLMYAGIIMDTCYGIRVKNAADPYVQTAERAMAGLSEAAVPGAFLVDVIPALKIVPEWFPFAGWKRKAKKWSELSKIYVQKPFEHVKNLMEQGKVRDSVVSRLLADPITPGEIIKGPEYAEELARNVSAVAYLGGTDTTACATESFFVAMCLYPEVQRKAQEEIFSLMKETGNLPTFADRSRLHYVNAVVEECLRWQIVAPLGVVHVLAEDDEYDNYFIPKGTVVMGNSWSVLHNPDIFPEPERFKPERFMRNGQFDAHAPGMNASSLAFGFGRRACPGQHFSMDALYCLISSTLAVYDIAPKLDDNERPIKMTDNVTSGFVSRPTPFNCTLTLRNPSLESLLHASFSIED